MIAMRFLRGFEKDLDGALSWYRRHAGHDVAQQFAQDYLATLERAARFPRSGKKLTDTPYELRRLFLKRFREHYLVFGLRKRTLVFVALAHTSRKHGYWKPRLAKTRP